MSKQYAHLHTMANYWRKTVGGVSLTRHYFNKAKKVEKKKSENYEQTICPSTHHGQNISEVSKWLAKNCRRCCTHETPTDYKGFRLTKLTKRKKLKKNLRIMSKQYAHLHAMAKTSVKFQNDWPKTVGGVALTSQLLTNGRVTIRLYRTCVLTQVRQQRTGQNTVDSRYLEFQGTLWNTSRYP